MKPTMYAVTYHEPMQRFGELVARRHSLKEALREIPGRLRQIGRRFVWRDGIGYLKITPVREEWDVETRSYHWVP